MGALIALAIAKRAPERLAGLVLIAGSPDWSVDGFWSGGTRPS